MRDGHVADLLVGRQEGLDRHRIGDLAHADQLARNLEDLAVQRLVEMRRFRKSETRSIDTPSLLIEDRAVQRFAPPRLLGGGMR
jgi:hypothetical protein